MKAIRIYHHGGPDVLQLQDIDIRQPGRGEVVVRNRAIAVNFTDIYSRNGTFPPPELPFTPGKAAAGEVVLVGNGVTGFAAGDRVAFVETLGAYAEQCVVPEHFLVRLPTAISFDIAAASLLRGLTAYFLLHRTFPVQPGHIILVHAAAGGVGSIMTQWAKHLGAVVIGTVGSPTKAEFARENGCDHVIDYRKEDVVARIRDITGGRGCHVVYDSVGKDTFPSSLDCLRPFGHFISFGMASGPIPAFDIKLLLEKGSLYAAWPGLTMHLAKRADVLLMSQALFEVIASGVVKIDPPMRLALADAADAHRQLEARTETGVMTLLP